MMYSSITRKNTLKWIHVGDLDEIKSVLLTATEQDKQKMHNQNNVDVTIMSHYYHIQ